jgi:acetylornithine deacetylase/succinyl-diaminopimelate desuccinylase-like protein
MLLVMVHVDTVFDAETDLTNHREGDDLVGPGVGDNAAAVMAVIWAAESIPERAPGLAIAFTVGEEGLGNLRGALHACADLHPATAIALEGHGLDDVIVDHVGSLRAHVRVSGPGGHSWWDRGTPSALHALVSIAERLARDGANVGTIAGGRSVNAIAADAEMMVERRALQESELKAFAAQLERLTVESPLRLACDVVGRRPAGRLDRDHPLVQRVRAIHTQLGLPDTFGSGSTDANAAMSLGVPAVALGCARGSGMHALRERIDLCSLEAGCRQVAAILSALADP